MPGFSVLEQLQQLKGVTIRTGAIHEAQALQLRNYPKLLTGVISATTHVDVEHKCVSYDCKVTKGFKFSSTNKAMCNNIVVWIRTLLWDDTTITFKSGKLILFDSKDSDE